jgi:tetratricopeptide (TPR) repeat protein
VEFRIGQVHTVLRDVNAAEAAYLKAAAMSPEYAEPVIALAQLYEQNGRAQDAMKLAEDLRGRFPKLPLGHELKGDLLVRAEQYAQASRSYEAAYALRPSGAIAVKHHGAMARAGAKADGTRLDQWLKAHPDDAATRQYLADQQLRAGDLVAAGENYRKVLKAQPDNAFAMNNLANVYLLQKDPRALETAQEALKLSPNNANIIDTVGFALTESGAAARAVPLLRKAVSLDPDSTEYRVHLATALARSGDREAARAEVKRLVDAGRRFQLDDATRAVLK